MATGVPHRAVCRSLRSGCLRVVLVHRSGYYKQASICEVIHFRYAACQTVVASFDQIASIVEPLVSGAGTV